MRKGDRLVVTVPVTYEGDPLAEPITVPLMGGLFPTEAEPNIQPPLAQTVKLFPFQTETYTFELTVPASKAPLSALVVVNPAIYTARRAHEENMLPPWV